MPSCNRLLAPVSCALLMACTLADLYKSSASHPLKFLLADLVQLSRLMSYAWVWHMHHLLSGNEGADRDDNTVVPRCGTPVRGRRPAAASWPTTWCWGRPPRPRARCC